MDCYNYGELGHLAHQCPKPPKDKYKNKNKGKKDDSSDEKDDKKKKPYKKKDGVTDRRDYTKLSKKIIHQADDLANLSPYNPFVREITTDFKPTYIPAKIVISLAVTITNYIKVRITNTSEFKHSYYKPSLNRK
jgi:hypothetical protein